MTAADELAWWDGLRGYDVDLNLHGYPPYDLEKVGDRILAAQDDALLVLDLGCGTGRLTRYVSDRLDPASWVYGVDISPRMIESAHYADNIGDIYIVGDGRTLPESIPHDLDLAYSVTMLQHIPDDAKWGYIHQVYDHLRSGGVFLFTIAIGEEDGFLNHQIKDPGAFCSELTEIFRVATQYPPDENNWTWVEVTK